MNARIAAGKFLPGQRVYLLLCVLASLLFNRPAALQSKPIKGCASEVGWSVGESPTRRIRLFTAEHDLNSVAARRGWKLGKMNRRAITKVNHIE